MRTSLNHSKRPPIVLLTDFGLRDPYAGVLRGRLLALAPNARVLDLSHGVQAQNIMQAAVWLESAYPYFPDGSIFLCVVDPGVGTKRRLICAKAGSCTFLAPDNGLLSFVLEREKKFTVRAIQNKKYFPSEISNTFHGRDILAPAAAELFNRPSVFSGLGARITDPLILRRNVKKKTSRIDGEILYFDHYGNAITSIQWGDADASFWRNAKVVCSGQNIGKMSGNYGERPGRLLALINSAGYLEIAVSKGSAQKKLNLHARGKVTVVHA